MNGLPAPRLIAAVLALSALVCPDRVSAAEPWLAAGDMQLRHDLQLLVDDGILELPVSAWPIAVSDLAAALSAAGDADAAAGSAAAGSIRTSPAARTAGQIAALQRLKQRVREGRSAVAVEARGALRPTTLRTFADDPREEGELSVSAAGFMGERYGGRLEVTAVADADDDQPVRLDGSYVAGRFGNWIVTAGAQDRWWGSGWEGSLILSSNARPVPAIALDRAVSKPFKSPWLSWIGPWRLTTFMGQMENGRGDYDHPLLFGMRISARPLDGLEISLERTAQWCGEGRPCGMKEFWNMFSGNDNRGENVSAKDEPGNQLAGWDVRWAKPWGSWNYAIYNQHTGESIDNKIPRPYRSFDIVGMETWGASQVNGSSWRAGVEYAMTRCGGTENGLKLWDCAYNNEIFSDGYRYRGRVMGHAMDGDGQMISLRYVRTGVGADTLTAVARYTKVNENGGEPDQKNSVARGHENWTSLDVSYRRPVGKGWVEAAVGVDQIDRVWKATDATLPRASLSWRQPF